MKQWKNRSAVSKTGSRTRLPANRYYRHSRLSEYRFLRILRAFADNVPATETARRMRLSDKSVRALYAALRESLLKAAIASPRDFGWAGYYLIEDGYLSKRGHDFVETVFESGLFRDHIARHGLRLRTPRDRGRAVIEVTIRMFCHIAMTGPPPSHLNPETREAIEIMGSISGWIRENMQTEGFLEDYAGFIRRFGKAVERMPGVISIDEIAALRDGATEHRYPATVLYDPLRRYLLKDPL